MDKDTKTVVYVAAGLIVAYLLFFRKPAAVRTVATTQVVQQAQTSTNSTGSTLAGLGSLASGLGGLASGLGSTGLFGSSDSAYN